MGDGFGGKVALPARLERARAEYGGWLARQPLSPNTRRAYATQAAYIVGALRPRLPAHVGPHGTDEVYAVFRRAPHQQVRVREARVRQMLRG